MLSRLKSWKLRIASGRVSKSSTITGAIGVSMVTLPGVLLNDWLRVTVAVDVPSS